MLIVRGHGSTIRQNKFGRVARRKPLLSKNLVAQLRFAKLISTRFTNDLVIFLSALFL